jgi:glycosyltransferase involved in cell wall biosynthesis
MPKVAIVIPVFNESMTIYDTITEFYQAMPEAEIVVVNNASTDDSAQRAQAALTDLGAIGCVLQEGRPGKANALRRAFTSIEADVYVTVDGDSTYPASSLSALIGPVLNDGADMVVGDRLSNGGYSNTNTRQFHGSGNRLVRWLVNRLFRSDLDDILSGYRALSRRFVHSYPIVVEGFEIETDITLHALDKRFNIVEVPVDYRQRPEDSQSKLNTFSDGIKVLMTIFRIFRYYKPLAFFGWLSVICALSSVAAGYPVLEDWFVHQYIYHVPLAILASALVLLGSLFLGVGLLLDAINHQDRRRFEYILGTVSRGETGGPLDG